VRQRLTSIDPSDVLLLDACFDAWYKVIRPSDVIYPAVRRYFARIFE
jgi:hypothetical protein